MRNTTKMLLMNNYRKDGKASPREEPESYNGSRRDPPRYPDRMEGRFRDREGRERYDDGRFAPQNRAPMEREVYPESNGPYLPPYYQEASRYPLREEKPRNKIGFSVDGEMERLPNEFPEEYPMSMRHSSANEMESRKGRERVSGYTESRPKLGKELAMEWAQGMENEDGTHGPHWTMEQTKQVQAQQGIDCDPVEFFLAINMMYSDYVKVAKKLGVNKVDFYACMAKAFLDDKDAGPDKIGRYFEYVVG